MLDRDICPQALDSDTLAVLADVPANGLPVTMSLPGRGDYQLISSSSQGSTTVTGLPLSNVDSTLDSINIALLAIAATGLVVAAAAGAVIIRAALRPLDRVAATATRVGDLPLDRGEVALSVRVPDEDTDPRTEVGKVGAALNRMLGHVASALNVRQESETRVRQFVADASHELRTPLASIRGYAELAGRYSDEVPPDVSHAMRRIQSESIRMTSLVEELLLLARLDAGRPLASEPVDLSRLVVDAVSDARVTSRDHRWQLEIPGEPVTVLGDGQALHQVLLNLLGNARAHTPPGTTVVTGIVEGDPGEVVLTVSDDGPGIPVALQPEVFERFARGDGSRSRASGGTGLGLSIVAAIVSAHGGEVALDSRSGRTVFTVRLTAAAQ
ncbi:cell wall metabolism sensor histidine kinase WalK [Kutzneria sp. 744]|uniref:sensor histidine kinase n=1 Tax=Kutzneria sp. (strain 744) TaxID=345341 RepID=UPI0003EED0D6|nr:HAMP domain-containing sensor histidine kinase [Kutzneria sp. 744]EWM12355.1 sensor histidine kinase TcrS [Kutzneria sp. 744]